MDPEKPALAELATAPSAGSSQDKDTAPAPGHLTFDASEKQGKATGAGFPRVGTRELRKELTQDDRDLAQAGYSDLATKKASEETHVDIVRAAVRTELADSCRRSSASRPISRCAHAHEHRRREAGRIQGSYVGRGCQASPRERSQPAHATDEERRVEEVPRIALVPLQRPPHRLRNPRVHSPRRGLRWQLSKHCTSPFAEMRFLKVVPIFLPC